MGSEWTDDDIHDLCKVLLHSPRLEKLLLNKNLIGNDGARVLSETLLGSARLKRLRLDYNSIGKKGAEALTSLIRGHPTLRSLTLNNNPLCKFESTVQEVRQAWLDAGKDLQHLKI